MTDTNEKVIQLEKTIQRLMELNEQAENRRAEQQAEAARNEQAHQEALQPKRHSLLGGQSLPIRQEFEASDTAVQTENEVLGLTGDAVTEHDAEFRNKVRARASEPPADETPNTDPEFTETRARVRRALGLEPDDQTPLLGRAGGAVQAPAYKRRAAKGIG